MTADETPDPADRPGRSRPAARMRCPRTGERDPSASRPFRAARPGANAFVPLHGIEAFHVELKAKPCRYDRPAIEEQPRGREVQVTDPFSNRIAFCEPR